MNLLYFIRYALRFLRIKIFQKEYERETSNEKKRSIRGIKNTFSYRYNRNNIKVQDSLLCTYVFTYILLPCCFFSLSVSSLIHAHQLRPFRVAVNLNPLPRAFTCGAVRATIASKKKRGKLICKLIRAIVYTTRMFLLILQPVGGNETFPSRAPLFLPVSEVKFRRSRKPSKTPCSRRKTRGIAIVLHIFFSFLFFPPFLRLLSNRIHDFNDDRCLRSILFHPVSLSPPLPPLLFRSKMPIFDSDLIY